MAGLRPTDWGASTATAGRSGRRDVERQSSVEDGHGSAGAVVVVDDLRVETEAAMEGDRPGVLRRRDCLQLPCPMALRGLGERRVQATPEPSAAGVVPRGDQMHVPGAARGDAPEDVPTDAVVGSGNQAG